MQIEAFSMTDYEEAVALWAGIPEVGLDDADARQNMKRFLARNPGMSFVARHEGEIVGAVLCGHDGRRGYLHHLAVLPQYRNRGIGGSLVDRCLGALAAAGISRCNIFIFAENEQGKRFWRKTGWSTYEGLELMFKSTETKTDGGLGD
jgi:ribosomal protein S18 acetylase RimI-like enzyme